MPRCPARRVIAEGGISLFASLDFFEDSSECGFVLGRGLRLLFAIKHNLPRARLADSLTRQGFHRRDRAKSLLLFCFCHV